MPGAEAGREHTYQWLLRALGAYLDQEPSCRISLAEVSDGFLVRLQRALHKLDPQVEHFKRETLVEQLKDMSSLNRATHSRARHQGIWARFPNGHQDFFRALGYELDEAQARGILVEELEDGIVLTYNYPSEHDDVWKKRMVVMGVEDIEAILNAAFERRGKPTES